jgi:hypothetical protein
VQAVPRQTPAIGELFKRIVEGFGQFSGLLLPDFSVMVTS